MAVHLSEIRAVVLDLDDTLYPERSYTLSGFAAVGEWLRDRLSCPFDPATRMQELLEAGERRHVFDRLLTEAGCANPALVRQMVEHYRTHMPTRLELFEDARLAIEAWRGTFRLGLISDGPLLMQRRKVEALHLEEAFDEIILTGEWDESFWKPHPRAFELMENRLGLHGSAVVYIADNCGKDFVSPRRLGWRTIWMRRPGGFYCQVSPAPGGEPEYAAVSFSELDLSPSAA